MRLHRIRWWRTSYGAIYRDKKPQDKYALLHLHLYCSPNIKGKMLKPRAIRSVLEFTWLTSYKKINCHAPSKRRIRRLYGKYKQALDEKL